MNPAFAYARGLPLMRLKPSIALHFGLLGTLGILASFSMLSGQAAELGPSCKISVVLDFCIIPHRKKDSVACENYSTETETPLIASSTSDVARSLLQSAERSDAPEIVGVFLRQSHPELQIIRDDSSKQLSVAWKTRPSPVRTRSRQKQKIAIFYSVDAEKGFPGIISAENSTYGDSATRMRFLVWDNEHKIDYMARLTAVMGCPQITPMEK